MGILRIDHPDIMEFITCKQDSDDLTNFNISCGVTNAFMEAVEADEFYDLINPRTNKPAGRLKARDVFSKIIEMAWHNGEPGIIFIDRLNEFNLTPMWENLKPPIHAANSPCFPMSPATWVQLIWPSS